MTELYFPLCLTVLLISFAGTSIIEKRLIPILSGKAKQPIYEGGPLWHMSKSGTPTMGGLAFLFSILISCFAASFLLLRLGKQVEAASLIISVVFAAGNSLIGIIDDLTKLRRRENAGLTPPQKLGLQFLLAVIFLMARAHYVGAVTSINFSFGSIELGILYYPLAIIILLGIVNCANLTDGVDGLASCTALTVAVCFIIVSHSAFSEVSVISSAIIGGCLGFLLYNRHPAKIFMGDTGSLFLGALTACLSFSLGNPLYIVLIGGVYVIEGVSVIMQVLSFKLTGKRIFKMAPLHHHLEKCGVSENRICLIAIITTLLSLFIALLLLP